MNISRKSLISVQASYKLYYASSGVITCDSVIHIPLADILTLTNRIDHKEYDILPVVEIIPPFNNLKLNIITNEGVMVEPFTTPALASVNPFSTPRIYFVLPRGTTGIKEVIANHANVTYKTALAFEIMPPPYIYEDSLFGVVANVIGVHYNQITDLQKSFTTLANRVNALENKRLYVKQVPLKSYPGFFKIFGTNDQNGILGWDITFTNTGNLLTLTSGNLASSTDNNIIINGAGITGHTKLTLTYDKGSNLFNLYAITEDVTGTIKSQQYLASGLGRTTDAPQDLHLLIDDVELDVLGKGSGFVRYI